MRKLIVATSCLFLFCAGWVFGEQTAWNGTKWKTWSRLERTLFVTGFTKGYAAGFTDGREEAAAMFMAARPLTAEEGKKLDKKVEQIDRKEAAKPDITIRETEAAVSTFYGDYRNTPVCWGDAISLSTASLSGKAPTKQELAAARKIGAESGCK